MWIEQPEAGPDLVGRTSARLLAAGVERRERLDALQLLAILDASIDTTGRVRRPLDDLAGEFELAPLSVFRSLDHLERAGAVQRDGGCVLLLGASPRGLGGMQLAGFLDDVRASFAGDLRASFAGDVPATRRPGRIARTGAALVAAAAAVVTLAIAPDPDSIERPVALRGTVTTVADEPDALPSPDLDRPTERIRPSTTIVAPTMTALDSTVVAAAAPAEECVPTSFIADRVDCIVDDGLGIEGIPEGAPAAPEQITPPPTRERPPPTPDVDAPATPDVAPPVDPSILDLPTSDTIEGVSRTFRS